ncbi:MAG: hypothetical protein CME06_03850 [Gemmatimonadetes bacterium]|nr:hypothetical protein [Gemmatimonadota bacterium]
MRVGAIGAFLPYVSASAGYSRIPTESFSVAGQTFSSPSDNYTLGTSASLPLFAGFRNVAGLDRSDASRSAARARFDRASEGIGLAAAQAFLDVLKAAALLDVAQKNVERSREQLERVSVLLEVGSVPPVDLYRQRGQLGSDRLEALNARDATENARNTLNIALGLSVGDRRPLVAIDVDRLRLDTTAPAEFDELIARALRQRRDLRAADEDVRGAEAGLRVSRSGYWPSADLTGNYNWNGSEPPGGLDDLRQGDSYSVGVSMSVPIFDRLATRSSVQRSEAELVYRRAFRRNLERELMREVASAHLAVENARERVELSRANLTAAEEELRLAEERYTVGAGTLLERNVASLSWRSAETNRVAALYDLLYARIALSATLGDPIDTKGGND